MGNMVNFLSTFKPVVVFSQQNKQRHLVVYRRRLFYSSLVLYFKVLFCTLSYILLLSLKFTINDLLGGRGWWLVKGVLVRDPFLYLSQMTQILFRMAQIIVLTF